MADEQPYKKQQLRSQLTDKGTAGDGGRNLVSKILSKPELFPDEFKSWLPRFLNTNVNFLVAKTQLPVVESVKFVGVAGNAQFLNSWVNYSGGFLGASYYKDTFGIIHLGGLVKLGTVGAEIFTLPPGYQPQSTEMFAGVQGGVGAERIDVLVTGSVVPYGALNTYTSLSGITFRAY